MEDLGFSIEGLLSEEEATELFEKQVQNDKPEDINENDSAEETVEEDGTEEIAQEPENVGNDEKDEENKENATIQKNGGSSQSVYSSIAAALKDDGIFPDLSDDELEAVKSADDFGELFEKAIELKLTEKQRRIDAALGNGVAPDKIKMYENALDYLESIDSEMINGEGEESENLRKQLIFADFKDKGFSEEKARKEVEKSFKSGSDIEDAQDAYESLKTSYNSQYENLQKEAEKEMNELKAQRKKDLDNFQKSILESDIKIGDTNIDKKTRQKIYDTAIKPVYKDPETGALLTEIQKFQKENPMEFLKQISMWYVLTNGGKDIANMVKDTVRAEKSKAIAELGRKINTSALNKDGTLQLMGGGNSGDTDSLLSGDWNIGW